MYNKTDKILLHHGSGGTTMQRLIHDLFFSYFGNRILNAGTDSALLNLPGNMLAFTTDSFVIDPLFFPGGDIGKLAVCGTVNDLAVSGAKPRYLSASFIIEEGFYISDLERVVSSMASEAKNAGIQIVTGDTKVVNKGKADKLFITTAGIGLLEKRLVGISSGKGIKEGDLVIVNGTVGDHGMTILNARESFSFSSSIKSDCTSLNRLIQKVLDGPGGVKFMRDATRGGLSTVLCELASGHPYGIEIEEEAVPLSKEVKAMCELIGFNPFYIANEGKVVMVVSPRKAEKILEVMRKNREGREAAIIGRITKDHPQKVILNTVSGGKWFLDRLSGDQLPRIC